MLRYLITYAEAHTPFTTDFFEPGNHWTEGAGMVVYDLKENAYTTDGYNWQPIEPFKS